MNRNSILIGLNVEHSDLEIARFLKVSRSFIAKFCKEMEITDRDSTAVDDQEIFF